MTHTRVKGHHVAHARRQVHDPPPDQGSSPLHHCWGQLHRQMPTESSCCISKHDTTNSFYVSFVIASASLGMSRQPPNCLLPVQLHYVRWLYVGIALPLSKFRCSFTHGLPASCCFLPRNVSHVRIPLRASGSSTRCFVPLHCSAII